MVKRVMWLLNHGAARNFEIPILKKLGFTEFFLPKKYPCDPRFRSVSVDYSEDQHLQIPPEELAILNEQDWYDAPSPEAWHIANKYFKVIFFILHNPALLKSIAKCYKGIAIWRTYGLDKTLSYTQILEISNTVKYVEKLHDRFIFGQAYTHLHLLEKPLLRDKKLDFPAGMNNCTVDDRWTGTNKKIFFVCPDIGFSSYYQEIYKKFIAEFGHMPHVIAGSQPIKVADPNVIGFVTKEEHERNMQEMRVMFYHSSEPNHIHYHPFEALRAGMPLVFMAGGILDQFGGSNLPGRCQTIAEAKQKIDKILNDDWNLIEAIRSSQSLLLEPMTQDYCLPYWQESVQHIRNLANNLPLGPLPSKQKIRIAIFQTDKGSKNRYTANMIAKMLHDGASLAKKSVELIIGYHNDADKELFEYFEENLAFVSYRPFRWKVLDHRSAFRALSFAGCPRPLPSINHYVPDDGINNFFDCDLWLFQSNVMHFPILPIRPYVMSVSEFSSMDAKLLEPIFDSSIINNATSAEAIFALSAHLRDSLIHLIGLPENKVYSFKQFSLGKELLTSAIHHKKNQFLWLTNLNNARNTLEALQIYYDRLKGEMDCLILGAGINNIDADLVALKEWCAQQIRIRFQKEFSLHSYRKALNQAKFIWQPSGKPQEWYSAFDALELNIPLLASEEKELKQLNQQFGLNVIWLDDSSPDAMAQQLKQCEKLLERKKTSADFMALSQQEINKAKKRYWELIEECL